MGLELGVRMEQKRMNNYGKTICQAREAVGLTQADLGRMLKRSACFISSMETGRRPMSINNGIKIAKACHCMFVIDGRGLRLGEPRSHL